MSDADDFLRGPSFRPDHPDFWALSDLMLQLDGQAEEGNRDAGQIAGEIIDERSLSYLALQRVMRAEALTGERFTMRAQITAAALYLEAFVMGARFAQRPPAKPNPFVKPSG